MFFDADEFLYLPERFENITKYLSQNVFNNFSIIAVPWVIYGDSDKLYYENKPVQERFILPANRYNIFYDNTWVKSIIRTNIKNLNWDDRIPFSCAHLPNVLFNVNNDLVFKICGVYGQPINPYVSNAGNVCKNINYDVHLKHYWCKSTEEFILKKLRGLADRVEYVFIIENEIEEYFKRNTFSIEKLNVLLNTYNKYKEKLKNNNVKII